MKKILIFGLIIVFALSVTFIGIGCKEKKEAETTAVETTAAEEAEEPYEIVLLIKLQHPFFDRQEEGIKEAGADLGVNAYMVGPAEADASQQVALVEDLIAKGVDAIIVCPNDPMALDPVCKKANDAGILTFGYEAPNMQNITYDTEAFDNNVFGRHILDNMIKYMGTSGKYVNFVGNLTAVVHNQWVDARVEYAKEKYPDLIEVSSRIESKEDTTVAYQKTLELLMKYPDLKGFCTSSAAEAPGVAMAIEEKGLEDETAVVGYGMPSADREYLKSGAMDEGSLYDPKIMGYFMIWVAYKTLRGEPITTGMEVPGMGKITVEGNMIYGSEEAILDITAENVDEFQF